MFAQQIGLGNRDSVSFRGRGQICFLTRTLKRCFPVGQRLGSFTRCLLYMGHFLSLGFLSCDTNPLWTASAGPLCVTPTGNGRQGSWGTHKAHAACRAVGNEVLCSLTHASRVSRLLPASMKLWQVTWQPVSRVKSWSLHSSWQALAFQVLEVNGVRKEGLSPNTSAHQTP